MNTLEQIESHILSIPEPKRDDIRALHLFMLQIFPESKLWFFDGKNEEGKVIANPTIGYGSYIINYSNKPSKDYFQIGLLANTTGISVHILGIKDKLYLPKLIGNTIGKASVTGYCIKFKAIKDIDLYALEQAVRYGISISKEENEES